MVGGKSKAVKRKETIFRDNTPILNKCTHKDTQTAKKKKKEHIYTCVH